LSEGQCRPFTTFVLGPCPLGWWQDGRHPRVSAVQPSAPDHIMSTMAIACMPAQSLNQRSTAWLHESAASAARTKAEHTDVTVLCNEIRMWGGQRGPRASTSATSPASARPHFALSHSHGGGRLRFAGRRKSCAVGARRVLPLQASAAAVPACLGNGATRLDRAAHLPHADGAVGVACRSIAQGCVGWGGGGGVGWGPASGSGRGAGPAARH
jgi:hypothetical protein